MFTTTTADDTFFTDRFLIVKAFCSKDDIDIIQSEAAEGRKRFFHLFIYLSKVLTSFSRRLVRPHVSHEK